MDSSSSSSSSLFSSSKQSRHTFLDLISSSLTEEDKHKLTHEFHQKNSLFNTGLMETYLAGEPLLLSIVLLLLFLSLILFCLAVLITICRFLGKCGGRRYQPFPHSSRRFLFLILSFLFCWLLLASSSLNFILSTASFYGQRNPSQLISVPVRNLNVDYPDYERGKRESILTSLFNDPDYDFDKIEEIEETTTTTSPSPFITETTRRMLPIGGDPMVVVTQNGNIEERGQPRDKELIDPVEDDGDEEEYIEGDEGEDDEERTTAVPLTTQRVTTVPFRTIPVRTSTIPSVSTTDNSPHWVAGIGEGLEWEEIINRGQHLPVATTKKITIQRMSTTTPSTTTLPSTTTESTTIRTRPTTTASTTRSTTQSTTTTPHPTTRRRTIPTTTTTTERTTTARIQAEFPDYPTFDGSNVQSVTEGTTVGTTPPTTVKATTGPVQFRVPPMESVPTPQSFPPPPSPDYSPFDRFDPTLNGIPSLSSHPSTDLPDYISFNDGDAIPIQIGRIPSKGSSKSGTPNVYPMSHRRQFLSLHTDSYRSTNRFFGLLLSLVLIVATLPSLLIVVLGAMYYGRGSHPMDRSKLSDIVGVLSVSMSLFLFFVVPLLLLYSTIGLLFSHTHHSLCPLVQSPTESLEDVVLVMEGCARVQTPLIRMAQSSLLAAVSAFPLAVLLLQLSNYFLRMRREHYWTHSDSGLM